MSQSRLFCCCCCDDCIVFSVLAICAVFSEIHQGVQWCHKRCVLCSFHPSEILNKI